MSNEKENPITLLRRKLGLVTQADLAALAGVGAGTITAVERGYLAQVPAAVLDSLEAYLPSIGETRTGIQAKYGAWRGGLSAEVRARCARFALALSVQPGIEYLSDDAVDAVLGPVPPGNGSATKVKR